jgi:hypothetical protein
MLSGRTLHQPKELSVMNRVICSFFAVSFLAVAGCSHAVTPVKGPDGQEWVAISCSHGAKNCWKAAGEFCPLGYETADEVQSSRGFLFFKHDKDEMLVRCKAPVNVAAASSPRPASSEGGHETAPKE